MKRYLAACLLLFFLLLHAVAADHHLHALVHHDAGHAQHHCVFVQMSAGQCLLGDPLCIPIPPITTSVESRPAEQQTFSVSVSLNLPARAPPVSLP
jgi:hypothetical protein